MVKAMNIRLLKVVFVLHTLLHTWRPLKIPLACMKAIHKACFVWLNSSAILYLRSLSVWPPFAQMKLTNISANILLGFIWALFPYSYSRYFLSQKSIVILPVCAFCISFFVFCFTTRRIYQLQSKSVLYARERNFKWKNMNLHGFAIRRFLWASDFLWIHFDVFTNIIYG